jgi:hypothetical protein
MIHEVTATEARKLIRQAVAEGAVFFVKHAQDRMVERRVNDADVKMALKLCGRLDEREEMPKQGGTCWRVSSTVDGRRIGVGVELVTADA